MFGSSVSSYLGVDLGSGGVKVVEIGSVRGKPKLLSYGYVDLPLTTVKSEILADTEKMVCVLKKICKESRARSTRVVAALPASSVFSTILNLPKLRPKEISSKKHIAGLIRLQAQKFLPLPLHEMILDWQVLEDDKESLSHEKISKEMPQDQSSNATRILLNAASRGYVEQYRMIFQKSGLRLVNLETDVFGLIRSLVGNDPSTLMMIDMGTRATTVSIVKKSIPFLSRSIDLGGLKFTQMIAEHLRLPLEEAEQFKLDLAFGHDKTFSAILKQSSMNLIHEARYVLQLWQKTNPLSHMEKIILTGGSALLPGLSEFLSSELGIRAFIGDPWARLIYPEELRVVLEQIGPQCAVAVGLAMRDLV